MTLFDEKREHIHSLSGVFFQACAAYEVRQTEIVNREVGKLKEATTLMNELLSSMNLPGTRCQKL